MVSEAASASPYVGGRTLEVAQREAAAHEGERGWKTKGKS